MYQEKREFLDRREAKEIKELQGHLVLLAEEEFKMINPSVKFPCMIWVQSTMISLKFLRN